MKKNQKTAKLKVGYVLSYKSSDYIRTKVIIKALSKLPHIEYYEARNLSPSLLLRYIQTLARLLMMRIRYRPDVYILGFRGHEIYWPVRLLTLGKPLIFDEFINMHDWLVNEQQLLKPSSWLSGLVQFYGRQLLKNVSAIITDTALNAQSSSKTYGIKLQKYRVIYVGADEETFAIDKYKQVRPRNGLKPLRVFFYGNMLPLHGMEYILEAAKTLRSINFIIVGGKGKAKQIDYVENYIKQHNLTNVSYRIWLPFVELPLEIAKADICLGGPFGNTSQSQRVITGKTFQFLAMGKPTVIGKVKEQVGFSDRKNCLLVKQGSGEALIESLQWCKDHRNQLVSIGKEGYQLFKERFSSDEVASRLKKVLEEVTVRELR